MPLKQLRSLSVLFPLLAAIFGPAGARAETGAYIERKFSCMGYDVSLIYGEQALLCGEVTEGGPGATIFLVGAGVKPVATATFSPNINLSYEGPAESLSGQSFYPESATDLALLGGGKFAHLVNKAGTKNIYLEGALLGLALANDPHGNLEKVYKFRIYNDKSTEEIQAFYR